MISPVRQDGVRYVLPALAALALLAGAGLEHLTRALRRPWLGRAIAGAFVAYLAVACARIHPYYLDYYGEQVGGPGTVARHRWFKVGWWGEGLGAAVAWVNAHAAPGARLYRNLQPNHLTWFRGDLWRDTSPAAAEWIAENDLGALALTEQGRTFAVPAGFRLVHEVAVQGLSLARIYHREP